MQNEFGVFAICMAAGFMMGILYEPFCLCKEIVCHKNKLRWVLFCTDILFFVICSVVSVCTAFLFAFPSFRVYMWMGYALGGIIYLKSLHIILAFLKNVCYNEIIKMVKKAKKREKTLRKEGETI